MIQEDWKKGLSADRIASYEEGEIRANTCLTEALEHFILARHAEARAICEYDGTIMSSRDTDEVTRRSITEAVDRSHLYSGVVRETLERLFGT